MFQNRKRCSETENHRKNSILLMFFLSFLSRGTSRDGTGQAVKIPSRPMAKFWACPVVPLSRDKEEISVPLSRKVALSRPVGNSSVNHLQHFMSALFMSSLSSRYEKIFSHSWSLRYGTFLWDLALDLDFCLLRLEMWHCPMIPKIGTKNVYM